MSAEVEHGREEQLQPRQWTSPITDPPKGKKRRKGKERKGKERERERERERKIERTFEDRTERRPRQTKGKDVTQRKKKMLTDKKTERHRT